MALFPQTQIIVTTLTAFAILHLRTAHSIWFGFGTLLATLTGSSSPCLSDLHVLSDVPDAWDTATQPVAKVLKRFLRQPRPLESDKATYGMPSTHSSSISFFGIYLFLSVIFLPFHPRLLPIFSPFVSSQTLLVLLHQAGDEDWATSGQASRLTSRLIRFFFGLGFLLASTAVCWSRVRLGHHTPAQVLAGALVGTLIAGIWFSLWVGVRFNMDLSSGITTAPMITSSQRHGLGEWGDQLERVAEDSSYLLLEAWQMRDGGLVWDGLARPALNSVGRVLGFGNVFEGGDQMGVPLAPVVHHPVHGGRAAHH